MNSLDRFFAYFQDFELTYLDDDWARLEQYFAPDVSTGSRAPVPTTASSRDARPSSRASVTFSTASIASASGKFVR
jgi:hypothetical protein